MSARDDYIDLNVFSDVVVEVYRDGRIKTKDHTHRLRKDGAYVGRRGKFLSPGTDRDGYKKVVLTRNGKRRNFTVHRLVALAYIPNPECKPTVNHINGVKDDNRVENLEWSTYKEQKEHAMKLGLTTTNEKALASANKRRSVPVLFRGRVYESLRSAARNTGVSRTLINKEGERLINEKV